MKNFTCFILCLFFSGIVSAQQVQFLVAGDISGICDATTILTSQGAGIGWDDCAGGLYEGTVEFETTVDDSTLYNVYTVPPTGSADKLNDLSFGAFYPCYGTEEQGGMPNSALALTSLFFEVNEGGVIGFSGSSQWGEVYSLTDVVTDGAKLNFKWTNDYGEGATVELVRQDEQLWDELFGIVSIQEISQIESISINPNPINSGDNFSVNIDLNESVDMNLQIIDITGKAVYTQLVKTTEGNNEINIDSHSLNRGMYFVKLSSENGVTTKKIIVQ